MGSTCTFCEMGCDNFVVFTCDCFRFYFLKGLQLKNLNHTPILFTSVLRPRGKPSKVNDKELESVFCVKRRRGKRGKDGRGGNGDTFWFLPNSPFRITFSLQEKEVRVKEEV